MIARLATLSRSAYGLVEAILVRIRELPVFLAIGVGYWIGKFKVKGRGASARSPAR